MIQVLKSRFAVPLHILRRREGERVMFSKELKTNYISLVCALMSECFLLIEPTFIGHNFDVVLASIVTAYVTL